MINTRLMKVSRSSVKDPGVTHRGGTAADKTGNEIALITAMSIPDLMYLKLITNDNVP